MRVAINFVYVRSADRSYDTLQLMQSLTEIMWKSLAQRIDGYEIVNFEDHEVQMHVARATEQPPIIVQPLQEDLLFSLRTCKALLETVDDLERHLSSGTPASHQHSGAQ